jgi:hypothetical protein
MKKKPKVQKYKSTKIEKIINRKKIIYPNKEIHHNVGIINTKKFIVMLKMTIISTT